MTVQLSPHKISKIMRGYFCGLTQKEMAQGMKIDQSSISHYVSRFKEMAAKYGLTAAGKEFMVLTEVESLRNLSVELYKTKLTVDEASEGHKIIKSFIKLGISPEQHLALVAVCKKVNNPGFIEAALKLSKIELQTGMSFNQITSAHESASKQLPQLQKEVKGANEKLASFNDAIFKAKKDLASEKEHLDNYRSEVKSEEAKLEKELSVKRKRLDVDKKELEEVATLKTKLSNEGLDLGTIIKLAKEFQYGNKKH